MKDQRTTPTIGLKRGNVVLEPHTKVWQEAFQVEKSNLIKILGAEVLGLEHNGSTAIPNIAAKPIIDILLGVKNLSVVKTIQPLLEKSGYTYRDNGSNEQQILFAKGPEKSRTHYLHITIYQGKLWNQDIAFRDYLRKNPDEAKKYETLKKELAERYPNDRKKYSAGKKEYIDALVANITNQHI